MCPSICAQAVTFLVIHQKHKKSLEEITNDLCPVLSVQQLYRISTMYWDDRYNTETVAHEVRTFSRCRMHLTLLTTGLSAQAAVGQGWSVAAGSFRCFSRL